MPASRRRTKNFPVKSGLSLTLFLRGEKIGQRFREILTKPLCHSKHRRCRDGNSPIRFFEP
jgi:hypothetical protein